MKKIASILGVMTFAFVLASCASKGPMDQGTTMTSTQTSSGHHHDYKGEVK
ncbi:MAG: hypothetical protein ACD_45C00701G0008 [uncultured bacterium]|nr:MAG: hypothetical protein ACD_45C00701G0008 [uncultured bacterium]